MPWAASVNSTVPSPIGTDGLEKANVGLLATSMIRLFRAGRVDGVFCRTLKLAELATIPTSWMVTIPLAVFVPSLTVVSDVNRPRGCRAR